MKKFHKKINYKLIQNNATSFVNYHIVPIIDQEQAEINAIFKTSRCLLSLLQNVRNIKLQLDRALDCFFTFKMIVRKQWIDRFFADYNGQKAQLVFCRSEKQYNGRIMENGYLINASNEHNPYGNGIYCSPTAVFAARGRCNGDCIFVCVAYNVEEIYFHTLIVRNKRHMLPIFLASS